jgi:hypothetical protein
MKNCGECRACCWLFPLDYLEKPAREWCKHCTDKGCAIYNEERNPVCTTYLCEWLRQPGWGEELRPDRCHIIYTRSHPIGTKFVITASQLNDYAYLRRANERLMTRLVRSGHIIVITREDNSDTLVRADRRLYPTMSGKTVSLLLAMVQKSQLKGYKSLAMSV